LLGFAALAAGAIRRLGPANEPGCWNNTETQLHADLLARRRPMIAMVVAERQRLARLRTQAPPQHRAPAFRAAA
jgi:hypothetical protein